MNKYRISDLILDSLKRALLHLGFYLAGFIGYALTAGHIMMDHNAELASKHANLLFFSTVMISLYIAFLCVSAHKNVGRKTRLIEASRADDFDSFAYYKEIFKRKIIPLFIGGMIAILPYTVFYTIFGWDYQFPSIVDRLYSSCMLCFGTVGGIVGSILYNALIAGVYAGYLYKIQKSELDDRMWLKDAPKQEYVDTYRPVSKSNKKHFE